MYTNIRNREMFNKDDETTINTRPAGNFAVSAAIDVKARSQAAYENHRKFFDNPEHVARVAATHNILNNFFKIKDSYENLRTGKGKPFTVIKITNHLFPHVSLATKDKEYTQPLKKLGVDVKFATGTNSYLYRIY